MTEHNRAGLIPAKSRHGTAGEGAHSIAADFSGIGYPTRRSAFSQLRFFPGVSVFTWRWGGFSLLL